MGILSVAGKAVKTVARYAFGNGSNKIAKARKSVVNPNNKSIFGKGNEFALKNSGKKISAGWNALKKDVKNTANSNKGILSGIKSFGLGIVSKVKAGVRLAEKNAAKAGKTASKWAKATGALKGLCKGLRRLPIVGTVIGLGYEVYECYDAFKRGGFWEGVKQVGVSALKLGVGAIGCALGTVIGGPVGGAIGFLAGDWIAGKLVGGSYSDNHPEEDEESVDSQQDNSKTNQKQEQKPVSKGQNDDTQNQPVVSQAQEAQAPAQPRQDTRAQEPQETTEVEQAEQDTQAQQAQEATASEQVEQDAQAQEAQEATASEQAEQDDQAQEAQEATETEQAEQDTKAQQPTQQDIQAQQEAEYQKLLKEQQEKLNAMSNPFGGVSNNNGMFNPYTPFGTMGGFAPYAGGYNLGEFSQPPFGNGIYNNTGIHFKFVC